MHVPYSMDDREPDLYGGMGGNQPDDDPYPHSTSYNVVLEYVECPKFYTQEDMNKVIQHNIKAVRNAYEEGYKEGNQNCQHR